MSVHVNTSSDSDDSDRPKSSEALFARRGTPIPRDVRLYRPTQKKKETTTVSKARSVAAIHLAADGQHRSASSPTRPSGSALTSAIAPTTAATFADIIRRRSPLQDNVGSEHRPVSSQHQHQPGTTRSPWAVFTSERLHRLFDELQLRHPRDRSLLGYCEVLDNIQGISPSLLFQRHATSSDMQVPTVSTSSKDKLQVQGKDEQVDPFLDRALTFFNLLSVDAAKQPALLMNAAQPIVAHFISELLTANTVDIDVIVRAVRRRFGFSKFQHLDQFRKVQFKVQDSIHHTGALLKRAYMHYLEFNETEFTHHENAIVPALVAQLLSIIPTFAANLLRQELLKEEDLSWETVIEFLDQVLTSHQGTSQPKMTSRMGHNTMERPPDRFCSMHGKGFHDDSRCRAQGFSRNENPHEGKNRCFRCNRGGHTVRFCRAHITADGRPLDSLPRVPQQENTKGP